MRRERIMICAGLIAAAVVTMCAVIWAGAEHRLAERCGETIAHQRMQIEQYERLMMDREARIHELEKEIAADK